MGSLQTIQNTPARQNVIASWYAVHTRFRHEKRVASELEQKGITTFLPLLNETRNWSDRRVKIEVPLFSCYVFVNISQSPDVRVSVLRTSGVLTFVGGNHLASSIPDREIQQIQTILEKKVVFEAHPFLAVGRQVRIRGGALDGVEGILSRIKGNDQVVVSVHTIQRSLSITVQGYEIEPVHLAKKTLYV